ncbi:MAG: hypothetical protein DMF83_01885 [Acidobacteria bacterium]|nr:MAG: hypothetical protein DMF83_01885 [Acidobacteriota bacterium]
MAFQGSLAELHLPDIIQLISVSGKTGVFHLTNGALAGEIYLNDGRIVHAQLDEASGEEAVYALAMWSQGDFRFDPGVATELRTITKSNTNLLMEAARRLDEWRVLSKKIPSTDMVPEFVVQEHREGQINLNTSEWLILSKIDGHRSLKAIADATRLSAFDAAKVLYGLVATGLIRLRPAASAVASGAAAPRSAAAAKSAPPAKPAPAARPAPAAASAAAAPPVTAASAAHLAPAASPESAAQLARLNRVREVCKGLLGPAGESVVNKHYQKARADIERGAGAEAVEEAIHQIARASSILKGPSITEALLEQLKAIK